MPAHTLSGLSLLPFCLVLALGLSACCVCSEDEQEAVAPVGSNQRAYKEWFAHHPSWARGGAAGTLTPQPRNPASLFQSAASGPSPLAGDMLLCQFSILERSGWDALGGDPDPAVDLTINQGVERRVYYGDGIFSGTVAWADVHMKPGDKLRFDVMDIDLSKHDLVGTEAVTWEGKLPLEVKADKFQLTCRALQADKLKPSIQEQRATAKQSLKALDTALAPAPGQPNWGYPAQQIKQARQELGYLAGLQTWAAPQVREQVERLDELLARWDRDVRLSIKDSAAKLPNTETLADVPGDFQVRVLAQDCNATAKARAAGLSPTRGQHLKQDPCYLTLKVKHAGQEPQSWTLAELQGLLGAHLVDDQGRDHVLTPLLASAEDGATLSPRPAAGQAPRITLEPGQSLDLVLEPKDAKLRMKDARLLRFQVPDSQKHALVRLR